MKVKAHLFNLRISPRKVRLVADAIRGLHIDKAKIQLQFLMKKSSEPVLKLLNSAAANAAHNFKLNPSALYVSEIFVNEGQAFKRGISQSKGRVHQIRKRTSRISLTLSEKKDTSHKGVSQDVVSEKKEEEAEKKKSSVTKKITSKKKEEEKKTHKRSVGISRRVFQAHES